MRAFRPPQFKKLTEFMRIKGVPVYAHWSMLLLGIVVLIAAFQKPAQVLAGWTAYFSIILIHECGHMIASQRRGCRVYAIELYPIHGVCRFDAPWSKFDHGVIAWGGVVAQAAIGVPLALLVEFVGFTPFDALNVAVGILSYYNLALAVFNLIPVAPFDGVAAWPLFPEFVKRMRNRQNSQTASRRFHGRFRDS